MSQDTSELSELELLHEELSRAKEQAHALKAKQAKQRVAIALAKAKLEIAFRENVIAHSNQKLVDLERAINQWK